MYCERCGSKVEPGDKYCTNCGALLPPPARLADLGDRAIAFIIDHIVVGLVVGLLSLPMGFPRIDLPFIEVSKHSIALFLYWGYLEGVQGRSLGKRLLGLRVVGPSGAPPGLEAGFIQAFGKAFLMPLDLVVGLLAYWDRRQRLFNHLSDTQVVEETG